MCTGEDKQLEAFARFVKLTGLRPNLERKDWAGFAISTIKNWKRLIGDLRSRKEICPNEYRFLFRPRFYAMPGIKPGIFR